MFPMAFFSLIRSTSSLVPAVAVVVLPPKPSVACPCGTSNPFETDRFAVDGEPLTSSLSDSNSSSSGMGEGASASTFALMTSAEAFFLSDMTGTAGADLRLTESGSFVESADRYWTVSVRIARRCHLLRRVNCAVYQRSRWRQDASSD